MPDVDKTIKLIDLSIRQIQKELISIDVYVNSLLHIREDLTQLEIARLKIRETLFDGIFHSIEEVQLNLQIMRDIDMIVNNIESEEV